MEWATVLLIGRFNFDKTDGLQYLRKLDLYTDQKKIKTSADMGQSFNTPTNQAYS